MTRDFIHINDFTILVEEASSESVSVDSCRFDEPVIAVAFYGSGDVDLTVKYGKKQKEFQYTRGLALSFYGDTEVEFMHTVSREKPLQCILIATSLRNLDKLPNEEGEIFATLMNELVNPSDHYVEGPSFFMTPEMQSIVDSLFNIEYEGKTKMMFFRSQITALLSHFFGQLALLKTEKIKTNEREKLNQVKDILLQNIENPPSLTEISKQIGLNTFKLKKEFKAYFGVPVFKYLQNERLTLAHKMIRNQQMTVQEASWHVGYDSLSSFSNAFEKKFGYRPSQIK
ncbi:MAG: AraC family transcriptional regulator [Algibacter sp.]|uniref:helix-turn-helix transcriptional regulator n=1 Tax=Algibacter sp. TaxID=1872428 RepID=UPI00260782DA|nr:AraC family transcriptional regulator [Algibacter sp.]MDG1729177.1 AraC family transcriptional regulator [Algibacter sp.]MDG2178434.1 AraC family transcriptional regulator [Algibacter sp.]